MEADGRSPRGWTRPGGLAALTAIAALAVVGCFGPGPTPQTIYRTYPPSPPGATAPATGVAPGPSGTPSPQATDTAEATPTAETTPTPAPTQSPTPTPVAAAPTVSSTSADSSAPDGRWQVSFRKPVVAGVGASAVTAMNDSIGTRVGAYISSFNGTPLPAVQSGDGPSTLKGDFSVAFSSPALLSLRFTIETYITGAAHPATEAGSLNFDVASGKVIQFDDMFANHATALPILGTKAHAKLTALLGADLLWPASLTTAFFAQAWVFTAGGLEMTWSQGAIASMAAGTPTISIPWADLAGAIARPGPAAGFVP